MGAAYAKAKTLVRTNVHDLIQRGAFSDAVRTNIHDLVQRGAFSDAVYVLFNVNSAPLLIAVLVGMVLLFLHVNIVLISLLFRELFRPFALVLLCILYFETRKKAANEHVNPLVNFRRQDVQEQGNLRKTEYKEHVCLKEHANSDCYEGLPCGTLLIWMINEVPHGWINFSSLHGDLDALRDCDLKQLMTSWINVAASDSTGNEATLQVMEAVGEILDNTAGLLEYVLLN